MAETGTDLTFTVLSWDVCRLTGAADGVGK